MTPAHPVLGGEPCRVRWRFAYEAGPTGFDLYRSLAAAGIRCEVAAPTCGRLLVEASWRHRAG